MKMLVFIKKIQLGNENEEETLNAGEQDFWKFSSINFYYPCFKTYEFEFLMNLFVI